MHRTLLIGVMLLIAVCFTGCTTGFFTPPSGELVKNQWQLVTYSDGKGNFVQVSPDSPITLNFYANGRFNGSAGFCTRYSGTFTTSGELITIGDISEESAPRCAEPSAGAVEEKAYLELLRNATRFNVDENGLSLSYYDINKLLVFAPV